MAETFTLIDDGSAREVQATRAGGQVLLSADAVKTALGWELKPEGLCQGDVCIPVRDREALVHDDGLDLEALARLLGRPLALDAAESAAALAAPVAGREAVLDSLQAPDFTLPDLEGKLHSLSDHRGKKVLLVAYASW